MDSGAIIGLMLVVGMIVSKIYYDSGFKEGQQDKDNTECYLKSQLKQAQDELKKCQDEQEIKTNAKIEELQEIIRDRRVMGYISKNEELAKIAAPLLTAEELANIQEQIDALM